MAFEELPFYDPADVVTGHCEVAVIGKRFVSISGPRVGDNPQVSPTGAGAAAMGIARRSAAIGEKVPIATEGVREVLAGAAITAGDPIKSDAVGRAIPQAGTGVILGYAWDDIADTATGPIKLNL